MNKGFNLLEMIIVLLIISILSLTLLIQRFDFAKLKWNMIKMDTFIMLKKREAILLKTEKDIVIKDNVITDNESSLYLDPNIVCESYIIHFNERGNVNNGGHFTCSYGSYEKNVVINLGSGNVNVK